MSAIPAGRVEVLLSMTTDQANRAYRESVSALRLAWQGRHVQPRRAAIVIGCNLQTMRDLVTLRDDIKVVV